MSVKVCFMRPATVGAVGGLAYGTCRASETVSVPGTTQGSAQAAQGEYVLVLSTESTAILMAVGSTPDASASTETSATTAAMALAPLAEKPVFVKAGDKLSFASFA